MLGNILHYHNIHQLVRVKDKNPRYIIKTNDYPDLLCELAVENSETEIGITLGPINDRIFDSYFLFIRCMHSYT